MHQSARARERERELQKVAFRRMHLQKDMHGICTVYARYRSQWFKMQFAAADSCRSHQGRPEDQAIVATVECNQADVGCLKDGPVTFEYLYNIYIYIPLINHEYYPRCQDDTRYKMTQDDTSICLSISKSSGSDPQVGWWCWWFESLAINILYLEKRGRLEGFCRGGQTMSSTVFGHLAIASHRCVS